MVRSSLRGQKTLLRMRAAHPGQVRHPARAEVALEEAAFPTAPSFHADRMGPPYYGIDSGAAELRAEGGERPSVGIEHAHAALAVHEDSKIAGFAVAGRRNIQNVFGLPQECFHEMLIGRE